MSFPYVHSLLLVLRQEKKEYEETIHKIVTDIKFDMLKKEGVIVSQCERLCILRAIISESFQYNKLDSVKRPITYETISALTKDYLLNSLWLPMLFFVIVYLAIYFTVLVTLK